MILGSTLLTAGIGSTMDDSTAINFRGTGSSVDPSVNKRESKIDIKEMCKKFETTPYGKGTDFKEKSYPSHNILRVGKTPPPPRKIVICGKRSLSIPNDVSTFHGTNSSHGNLHDFVKNSSCSNDMNNSKADSSSLPKFAPREVLLRDGPKAPVRRNRLKSQVQEVNDKEAAIETKGINSSGKSCDEIDSTNSSVKGVSVKERTKIFEVDSSSHIKPQTSVHRNLHGQVNKPSVNGKCKNIDFSPLNNAENSVSKSANGKERFHSVPSFPPSKPPRTPLRNKIPEPKSFSLSIKNDKKPSMPCKSAINEYGKGNACYVTGNQKKEPKVLASNSPPDSPSSHKYESIKDEVTCVPRLQSAPLRLLSDDTKESTPRKAQQVLRTTKTQSVLNYFKHLSSTANHVREKVKLKPSNLFVDLTPTTVSPPKHHGTLKKSYSDEHIYAEPIFDPVSSGKQAPPLQSGLQVSPYMCIPVAEPLPQRLNSEKCTPVTESRSMASVSKDKKFGISVRNMIYQSFHSLRSVERSKEDNGDIQDDSGSDVSAQDVQERIIYVKSMKKQASCTSICIAPILFEALFVVCVSKNQPEVVLKFPAKPKRSFDYPLIPHLCFPDLHLLKPVSAYRSETFHFTLINGKDEKIFGYCHRILGWPLQNSRMSFTFPCAICILSCISAPLLYKKLLGELEKHLILPLEEFRSYLSSLQMLGIPNAGASLSIPDNTEGYQNSRVVISRPLDCHIISSDFTRILQLLDIEILLKAVASLVLERRVLLLSNYSKDLFQCCEALSSLLYPFHWQQLIIPVVPKCLLVQCCTETPYLLGIISGNHTEILELLTEHEILIIDIDKASVVKSQGDEHTILPKKVQKALIMALNLAKNMTDPTEMLRDVMISEAFVRMFVETVGHYGEFLSPKDSTSTIQKEAFQRKPSSRSIQSFLEWFSETLMFDSFIEECIWRIKYREICQSHQLSFFEKRIEEYKWELTYDNEKLSQIIGKTMKNFGEKLKILKSF